jgi:2'-5' RNA ligase
MFMICSRSSAWPKVLAAGEVKKACETVNETRAEPFDVSFDRSMGFRGRPGGRRFVLTGDVGLRRLKLFRRSLAAAMMKRGLTYFGRREFTPHVTPLFDDRCVEEHPVAPVGWAVRDLVLIHSMKGHRHLARWPLHV